MTTASPGARRRRRLRIAVKESLRALAIQLSLLNRQVSGHLDLKDADLACLDAVNRRASCSPAVLARATGLHPATTTGVLDRLERGGWVARERDPEDRRGVVVRALRDRNVELYRLYGGMNSAMDEVCAGYDEEQLALIEDFLLRALAAGRQETEALSRDADTRRSSP
ncbi:MarR family transcriptional regulator [Amycolatopsis sp.]|uniref:MarR family transcriptional regulator n=1 Tax=Amycolatopsis sp. TaxID=37632 RepID=UPI002BB6594C|nr:MarR family transcriptional regulator [Amycolatopsis sp.]HVV14599.1 MarR family transcriptional regulator [Amycolatopsis sp.]